ncbi:DoxX family protein [Teredinibacter sp. KSP-S5-2]|uniref:DoxX family protein n=1 Tax=Teredinibacter sp. KSP-S5-2 TaxID=3034506 RepID=UPI0029350B91|nr:DoxX family protein [Teredinibacter sp. KSP-S5-2]WNO11513.1 DoxX family protein [Teredinibacter sp. KSP-S5-2]
MQKYLSVYYSWESRFSPTFLFLESLALVYARIHVGWIFLKSGLLKLQSWETTLMLFEYEYEVPFLSPKTAAILGTGGEIVLPILLIAGLFSRFSAVGLLVVNYVALISLVEISPAAQIHHVLWGVLLLAVLIRSAGVISFDHFLRHFLGRAGTAVSYQFSSN